MIIFLDFDGVLNSSRHLLRDPMAGIRYLHGQLVLDPVATRRLASLVSRTRSMIVISSDWRKGKSLPFMRERLQRAGLRDVRQCVVDVTPDHGPRAPRGGEIREWMLVHGRGAPYVVLDDRMDMDAVKEAHVWVDPVLGLLDHHINRAIVLLGRRRAA